MGRVSKYKKIKSCDPFSKKKKNAKTNSGGKAQNSDLIGVWGYGDDGRRPKKRSATATALKLAKLRKKANNHGNHQLGKKRKQQKQQQQDVELFMGDKMFDLPPTKEEGDDFDMSDIVGSVKVRTMKEEELLDDPCKEKETNDVKVAANHDTNVPNKQNSFYTDEALREVKLLKLDVTASSSATRQSGGGGVGTNFKTNGNGKNKLTTSATTGRREGESMRAFERRIEEETRLILKRELREGGDSRDNIVNPEKYQRKKEFLKNKKLKKKKKGNNSKKSTEVGYCSGDDVGGDVVGGNDDATAFITGERAVARLAFLDQADRPPVFTQLPRGAQKIAAAKNKAAKKSVSQLSLGDGTDGVSSSSKRRKGNHETMNEQQVEAEQRAMEAMRNKIRAQYALVKAKRRKAGDFHL